MTEGHTNRVINEVNEWTRMEQSLKQIFSDKAINGREGTKQRMDFFKELLARYKDTTDKNERIVLQIMKAEVKNMEMWLYPSIAKRFWQAVIRSLRKQPKQTTRIVPKKKVSTIYPSPQKMEKAAANNEVTQTVNVNQANKQEQSKLIVPESGEKNNHAQRRKLRIS